VPRPHVTNAGAGMMRMIPPQSRFTAPEPPPPKA
jgi:hypothetical protein